MKPAKKICIFLLLLCIAAALIPFPQTIKTVADTENLIRIHVRANDDSEEAQAMKLRVRDAINIEISKSMNKCSDVNSARSTLNEMLPKLKKTAEAVCGQPVSCTLGRESFPDRYYDNILYPAGEYEALIVRIGEGSGANWWCVAFPPLCYSAIENASPIPQKVTYRSFFAELWHCLFG